MGKKVLVTGGAGFIGSHLVEALLEAGHETRVLDCLDPQVHQGIPKYLCSEAEFIRGDVRNASAVRRALRGVEVVFHQAAAVGVGQSMYEIQKYVQVNTWATAKLLELLTKEPHRVERLIVASSMSAYGEGAYHCVECRRVCPSIREEAQLRLGQWEMLCPKCGRQAEPLPTAENKPLSPTSIYAITKRDQEEMCLTVGRAYGLPTVALRYFNVYGPRQALSNPYTGVCAIFSSRIKNGRPPVIFEDGLQSRDFTSVHDVVRANLLAMEAAAAEYQVFNVGTGRATTVLEVARTLVKLYGAGIEPQRLSKFRLGDVRHCFADISKIRQGLGFEPTIDLESGMAELIRWAEEEDADDNFHKAQRELLDRGLVWEVSEGMPVCLPV